MSRPIKIVNEIPPSKFAYRMKIQNNSKGMGNPIKVYPITAAQVASGEYQLMAGRDIPVYEGALAHSPVMGHPIPALISGYSEPVVDNYLNRLLNIGTPIAIYPMTDSSYASGAIAVDACGNYHGDYSGSEIGSVSSVVTGETAPNFLIGGSRCVFLDPSSHSTGIMTAIANAITANSFSASFWYKAVSVGTTNSRMRYLLLYDDPLDTPVFDVWWGRTSTDYVLRYHLFSGGGDYSGDIMSVPHGTGLGDVWTNCIVTYNGDFSVYIDNVLKANVPAQVSSTVGAGTIGIYLPNNSSGVSTMAGCYTAFWSSVLTAEERQIVANG